MEGTSTHSPYSQQELLILAQTSKYFQIVASDNLLWKHLYLNKFNGVPIPNWKSVLLHKHFDSSAPTENLQGSYWKHVFYEKRIFFAFFCLFQVLNKLHLSQEQHEILKAVRQGKNVFITGCGGTGKSFVINVEKINKGCL